MPSRGSVARQEAAPEATAPDPAVIAFCKAVWPDDLSSQVPLCSSPPGCSRGSDSSAAALPT